MKNLISTLFFTVFIFYLQAQESQGIKIGLYQWTEEIPIHLCNINGDIDTLHPMAILSKLGSLFRIIDTKNGYATIKFLDFTSSKDNVKNDIVTSVRTVEPSAGFYSYNFVGKPEDYNQIPDIDANERLYGKKQAYFKVAIEQLSLCAVKYEREKIALAFGVINFPFKYRFQKDKTDFTGAFNFGAAVGFKLPSSNLRPWKHTFLIGYSISNIVIDSVSADRNQSKLSSTNNFTAFSLSLGYMIEYKGVQAGIFLGRDQLSRINQEQFGWHYQGKPWLSVGLGYSIFSTKSKETSSSDNVQSK